MSLRFLVCLLFLTGLGFPSVSFAAESSPVALFPPEVRRIIFLGDSITYAGGYVVQVESYVVARLGARAPEFLNLGLSSETVSGLSEPGHGTKEVKFPRPDLHERLERVLTQTKPELVFACYGMNDGIGLPFAAERFAAFRSGIERLRTAVTRHGARLILLTPPVFDSHDPNNPGYDAVLAHYSAWLLEQRSSSGWTVFDVRGPMLAALHEGRLRDPAFTFARDRIHPDAAGHRVIARAVLAALGARDLDSATPVLASPQASEFEHLHRERSELLRNAWLSATGHQRPGVKAGLPLAEAHARAAEITRALLALRSSSDTPGAR